MKLKWTSQGKFKRTIKVLDKYKKLHPDKELNEIGKIMCDELRENTPKNTGELSHGWNHALGYYRGLRCVNIINGTHPEWPELIKGLEWGHGTGTGGYVPATHFVTNSLRNVEDQVSEEIGGIIKNV